MALVHAGNARRRTEGTAANPVSSRSHAVLQVRHDWAPTRLAGRDAMRLARPYLLTPCG
jgi:hypothetical protein